MCRPQACDRAGCSGAGLRTAGCIAAPWATSDGPIEVPSVSSSFSGEIDATGIRLVGTWSQRALSLPLTFARDAK
jgi:hypothetical protein